jgi:hypothetical protein
MRPTANQLPLFPGQPPAAGGNHARIEYCTKCGGEIVVQRYTADDFVSEYRSRNGECFACAFQPNLPRK